MADTRLVDLVIPEVFTAYLAEMSAEKSALIQSNIIQRAPIYDQLASGPGSEIQIPFFKPLVGAEEVITEGTPLTTGNITTGQQATPKIYRGRAFGASDIGVDFSGEDVMMAIMTALVPYRNERLQDQLISCLQGAFVTGGPLNLTHVNDISAAAASVATIFSSEALIDTMTLLGDMAFSFTETMNGQRGAIIMHSQVYADAIKGDLVLFLRDTEKNYAQATINGLRVIVDDDVPVDTSGGDGAYTSYIFAPGAVIQGDGTVQFPMEDFRDELGSVSGMIYRRQTIMHLNGLQWVGTPAGTTATDTELETGANWGKVFSDDRNIKVVALVTNVGSDI